MAVQDKYVNTNLAAEKLGEPALIGGNKVIEMVTTFEVLAADDDGSVYRIAQGLNSNLIPIEILIYNDALTSSSDWDLGLYKVGVGGAVIDANVFMANEDINAGNAIGSPVNGLSAVVMENLVKKLYEHAAETIGTRKEGYDLALTANTVGSATGTVTVIARFIQG